MAMCVNKILTGTVITIYYFILRITVNISLSIAELCSGESLPEVEIISLLEEQIPKYKLRADTLTKFGGKY